MSAYQEFTGKTVEEALRNAREAFEAGLDDLDFEILTPGSRGVLGMGAEPARIVAAPRSALGGAAPKREAAASAPLPLPPPPARERGDGDRDRGPGGYRGGPGAPGGSRDDRGPRDAGGDRDDRRRTGAPPSAGYRDDRPPSDDRPPRTMPASMGDEAAAASAAATASATADASAAASRNLADADRVRDRAPGRGGPSGPGGSRGAEGRTASAPGGRPPRGGAPRGGAPRSESGGSPRAALSAAEIAELVAARSSGVERDEEDTEVSPEALAAGQEILTELMRHLGFDARVDIETGQTSRLNVVGEGEEKEALGALIGRKGERLSALQHLVNLMLSRRMDTWTRVLVDVEDYRGRRERQLRDLATRAAERVVETGKMLQLEPMPALERRWIHIALRDHPDVATQSIGEEPNRRVVVVPRAI